MTRLARYAVAFAASYVVALVLVLVSFRFIGERWWPVALAQYLPRLGFFLPLPVVLLALVVTRRYVYALLTTAASLFLVIVPIMGFQPFGHDRPAEKTIRVLTWNTLQGRINNLGIRHQIDEEHVDIFVGQAMGHRTKELFRSDPGDYIVDTDEEFLIATKFPIVEKKADIHSYSDPIGGHGNYVRYTLDTPLGLIDVFNIHPKSPRAGVDKAYELRSEAKRGRFERFSAPLKYNIALRRSEVDEIVNAVRHAKHPVIVAGDTNLPGLSWLLHQGLADLNDAFVEVGHGFGYSFPARRPWMRIDRVMADDTFRFTHVHTGTEVASDHMYVVADVALK